MYVRTALSMRFGMLKTKSGKIIGTDLSALPDPPVTGPRFLRKQAVIDITGVPGSTIYELMNRGAFPRPVRISPRLVCWIEAEIETWQRARIAERDAKASARSAEMQS